MGKSSASSAACFLRTETVRNGRGKLRSESVVVGGCSSVEKSGLDPDRLQRNPSAVVNPEIRAIDSAGVVVPLADTSICRKSVDDVWREIMAGKKAEQEPKEEMMTLEEFLLQAGVMGDTDTASASTSTDLVGVKEESVVIHEDNSGVGVLHLQGMRGKRSSISLDPLDKASLQRQKRMIKNRESAARSRERKQAYQVELESMVMKLEEENLQLLQEKAERTKKRLKQLMENVIPLTEKQTSSRLQRFHSTEW